MSPDQINHSCWTITGKVIIFFNAKIIVKFCVLKSEQNKFKLLLFANKFCGSSSPLFCYSEGELSCTETCTIKQRHKMFCIEYMPILKCKSPPPVS